MYTQEDVVLGDPCGDLRALGGGQVCGHPVIKGEQLTGDVGHHVHRVSAAHADTETSQSHGSERVFVGADHQQFWKS